LPIPAIGNSNYCRTSITSFNKNVGNNTNGIRGRKELTDISQQRQISQTERFRTKMRSTFGNTHICGNTYILYDEACQIYSKNRNGVADETRHSPTCCH